MKKMFLSILFGNNLKTEQRNYTTNTIAGIINAFHAVILLMVVTRLVGLEAAGILTIAFAISKLMVTIGKFSVRNYQVTDLKSEYDFYTYLKSRLITVGVMLVVSIGYCLYSYFFSGVLLYKIGVIFMICLIYAVDSIEDVFWGEYQKRGRLDVGAVICSLRWIITIIVFCVTLFLTGNLFYSTFSAFLAAVVSLSILLFISYREFDVTFRNPQSKSWGSLLRKCFPLFAGAFFMIYITNSPKYAIEACLSDEIQACYGFISMPVFVIELLNNFIYQPKLIMIAKSWEDRELIKFRKYIVIQCISLFVITTVCILGGNWIGIPILSIMYSTDLSQYHLILILVLIGGGLLAFTGFFAVLLTVMRKQTWMMYGYIIVAVLALLTMNPCVKKYGVLGGSILYNLLIFMLTMLLLGFVIIDYKQKKKSKRYYDEKK